MKSNHYFGFERGTIATLEESESPRVAIAHVTRHSCEPVTVMMSELKRGQHIGDQLRDSEIPVPISKAVQAWMCKERALEPADTGKHGLAYLFAPADRRACVERLHS
jgi:hypothetical protein